MRTYHLTGLSLLAICALMFIAWIGHYHNQAERNLQSLRTLSRVIEAYIIMCDDWPSSESELMKGGVHVKGQWPDFDWPENATEILRRVQVDYSAMEDRSERVESLLKINGPIYQNGRDNCFKRLSRFLSKHDL